MLGAAEDFRVTGCGQRDGLEQRHRLRVARRSAVNPDDVRATQRPIPGDLGFSLRGARVRDARIAVELGRQPIAAGVRGSRRVRRSGRRRGNYDVRRGGGSAGEPRHGLLRGGLVVERALAHRQRNGDPGSHRDGGGTCDEGVEVADPYRPVAAVRRARSRCAAGERAGKRPVGQVGLLAQRRSGLVRDSRRRRRGHQSARRDRGLLGPRLPIPEAQVGGACRIRIPPRRRRHMSGFG